MDIEKERNYRKKPAKERIEIGRRLMFPLTGRFGNLYKRLKMFHLDEEQIRDYRYNTHDAMLELLDEALQHRGY